LVLIAPHPVFPLFIRYDHRVVSAMIMGGGVLVLGVITAADVSASQAEAKVHPLIPHFQAVFAAISRGNHIVDFHDMDTALGI
jgi:hypothetical protein